MATTKEKPGTKTDPVVLDEAGESAYDRWAMMPTEENEADMLAGIDGDIVDQVQVTVFVYFIETINGKRKPWKVWDGDAAAYRAVGLRSIVVENGSGDYQVRIMVKVPGEPFPVVRSNNIYSERLSPAEERQHRMIRAAAEAPLPGQAGQTNTPGQPAQPAVTLQDVATIVTQGIAAAMSRQPDPLDQMQKMAGIFAAMRPESGGHNLGIKDVIEMAGTLADLRSAGGGESSSTEILLGKVVDKFGGPVADMLTAAMKKPDAQQQAQPAPVANPAPALPRQPAAVQQEELMPGFEQPAPVAQSEQDAQIAASVGQLLPFARAGVNVGPYAEMAFDALTEEAMAHMLGMSDEEIYTKMASLVPDVKNNEKWFRDFIAEVRDLATPEETGGT